MSTLNGLPLVALATSLAEQTFKRQASRITEAWAALKATDKWVVVAVAVAVDIAVAVVAEDDSAPVISLPKH